MKRNIDIDILGHKYTIKSDEQEDHVFNIVYYLNEKIEEVLRTTKTVDTLNVLLLAALNIAGELFRLKDEEAELHRQIENTSQRLITFIDSQIEDIEIQLAK
ncbi:MAG: cell division protein ZapA [Thermodesulfobacteriota bacterium]|nr:cell division protein ZapA [Thermodesulfobacteriota bacterium]